MDDEIKSAHEIAMEKVAQLGEVTDQERLSWKYIPEGEKLAARYLKQGLNLVAELSQYEEKVKEYVIKGAEGILARNINLPKDEAIKKTNRRAMDGLKALKRDKAGVENIFSQMRRLFDHYLETGEQQRRQAYETLKADFNAKVQQAVQQQTGMPMGIKIDIEREPQFQEEWRRMQAQLDTPYLGYLDQYKQALASIS
ncbi:MAG: hypothetical protein JSW30_02975 [Dehalococcoidia bacterium]|nr:MAG: hypothetical protein JSW30_02975 [Dehalococcoidia bacterium]